MRIPLPRSAKRFDATAVTIVLYRDKLTGDEVAIATFSDTPRETPATKTQASERLRFDLGRLLSEHGLLPTKP